MYVQVFIFYYHLWFLGNYSKISDWTGIEIWVGWLVQLKTGLEVVDERFIVAFPAMAHNSWGIKSGLCISACLLIVRCQMVVLSCPTSFKKSANVLFMYV